MSSEKTFIFTVRLPIELKGKVTGDMVRKALTGEVVGKEVVEKVVVKEKIVYRDRVVEKEPEEKIVGRPQLKESLLSRDEHKDLRWFVDYLGKDRLFWSQHRDRAQNLVSLLERFLSRC